MLRNCDQKAKDGIDMQHKHLKGGERELDTIGRARIGLKSLLSVVATGMLLAAFNASPVSIISAAQAQTNCTSTRTISAARWSMVGISCENNGGDSIESVFGNDFAIADYASGWVLYQYQTQGGGYTALPVDAVLNSGEGYWLYSLADGAMTENGVSVPVSPKSSSPECASDAGCFEIALDEPDAGESSRWNLLSQPLNMDTDWQGVCITDGTTSYSPSQADVLRLMSKNIYKYNGNAYATFDDVTPGLLGTLKPNEGFWIELLESAVGKDLKLLIPAGAATDPCGNLPPSLTPIQDQGAQVDTTFSVQASATDPDPSDTLGYSLPTAPTGMAINNSTGLIQWTPSSAQLGANPVTVRASDPLGLFDEEIFQVNVNNTNNPPDLIPVGDRSIRAGIAFSTPLFAVDPDPGDSLIFSLFQAPQGMTLGPQNGILSWTPGMPDLGQVEVIAKVQDSGGLIDTEPFTVNVFLPAQQAADNAPPVLTLPDDQTLVVNTTLGVQASATDPDAGDILVFSFIRAPAGMSIDPDSGDIDWTPTASLIGAHDVTVKVVDRLGALDTGNFRVTVEAINQSPVAVDEAYAVNFGQTLSISAPGVLANDSDPDNDPLTSMLVTPPDKGALAFNDDGSFIYSPNTQGSRIKEDINLTLETRPIVRASSEVSINFQAKRAIDGDLDTSWFTARISQETQFIELEFVDTVLVKRIEIFGNRQFASLFDFLSGKFELFDVLGNLLYESNQFDLPGGVDPNRDFVHVVDPPVANVYRVRFTSTEAEQSHGEAGISEFNVFGDGISRILTPDLEWSWTESTISPSHVNVAATPTVCDLDADGVAEIIFPAYNNIVTNGVLRVLNGQSGAEVFTFNSQSILPGSQAVCGDVDQDGLPEIVVMATDNTLLALESDGTLKWQADANSFRFQHTFANPALALVDLDADGSPEIVMGYSGGVVVFDGNGEIRWSKTGGGGFFLHGGIPSIADVDLDGKPEIIGGNTVYEADGTILWESEIPDGTTAVGNFDADAFPEIVLVRDGVYLLDHDGNLLWGPIAIPGGGRGGPPTVADFSGDGKPEIGVAGSSQYVVFNSDGSVLWQAEIQDFSSNATGSTVFDFENDGVAEVVYRDERNLWVFRGTNGAVLFKKPLNSGTWAEYPVVADVDGDARAEIVVGANPFAGDGINPDKGLYVFGSENWVAARPIWNQYSYAVTNVNIDGTIPLVEQPNWLTPGLNNFRQNEFLPEEGNKSGDSFTYKANDGALDSNEATVNIDLLPVNSAPEFVSTPLDKATAGFEYLYGAQAIDQEQDTISFALVSGPTGMTVDPPTGLVRWLPTLNELGEHDVTLNVTDSKGFSSLQAFTVLVVYPLEVPDVLGDTLPAASSEITLVTLAVGRISEQVHPQIPEGRVISQSPAAGTLAQMGDKVDLVFSLGRSDTSDDGNQPPLAVNDNYLATVGVELSVAAPGVMNNDSDPDGDTTTATIIDLPTQGTATLQPDGAFTYLYDPAPPVPGNIEVEPYSCTRAAMDAVGSVTGQVAVGDVDNDGTLEIVGIHFSPGASLFILNAETCEFEYDQVVDTPIGPDTTAGYPTGRSHIGLVNLDDDPDLEIVFTPINVSADGEIGGARGSVGHLVALNRDGSFVWNRTVAPGEDVRKGTITPLIRNPANPTIPLMDWRSAGPTFADLDGDGKAEIIMGFYHSGGGQNPGVVAFNGDDGSVKWIYFGAPFFNGTVAYMPQVADIDLDGTPEVIYDRFVLDHNGNLEFELPVNDGPSIAGTRGVATAIANFDDDAFAEILLRHKQYFFLFEHDGTLKWKKKFTDSTSGDDSIGTLTVGDFDGDGEMEFTHRMRDGSAAIFGNNSRYQVVYDTDGSMLWSHLGQEDYHSTATLRPQAVVAFDVNQDGADDIVASLRIDSLSEDIDLGPGLGVLYAFNGKDGSELFRARAVASTAGNTFPVIADLDNDGAAEIITGGTNNLLHVPSTENFFIHRGKPTSPLPPAPPLHTQWVFNPGNVNLDGSIPVNPNPYWLIPGLNGFNKVPTVRDVQEPPGIQDSFTYAISDGAAFSNTATVNLTVSPPMSPPEIVSTPLVFGTENLFYQYVVFAVDPDIGDTLSYALTLAPSGMTIDPLTGIIQWLPGSGDVGDHAVRAIVQDSDGLADIQDFMITVAAPTLVPDVLGKTTANAQADIQAASLLSGNLVDLFSKDISVGSVVEQTPLPGTQVANGSKVHLFISRGPGPLDSDDDSDGQTGNEGDCDDTDPSIYRGATDTAGDGIDQNCDGVDGNFANAQIIVEPDAPLLLTGQSIALKATAVFPDQTSIDISNIGIWSSGNAAIVQTGATGIIVAAGAGNTTVQLSHAGLSGSTTVTVVATDPGDPSPPTALITSPERNRTITAPVDIIGTASDSNFLKYTLEIAPVGETNFTQIAINTNQVIDNVLGQFDPTLLLNDLYTVRLTVYDQGGNTQTTETVYQVDENMKVGNFSLSFTDLQIPMSGIPITVNRVYDSRDKRKGDFGIGWRLDVQTLNIRANRVMGTGWNVIKSSFNFVMQSQGEHKISLTLPDGRVEEFDMVISPTASIFVPFSFVTASYTPRPGTLGTLNSLDNNYLLVLGNSTGDVELVDDTNLNTYNPKSFRYTSAQGVETVISTSTGVLSIKEPNGNSLTFNANGIFHSSGKQALFQRDSEGRIIKLIAPDGVEQRYQYDENGDLASYQDQEEFLTRFSYNRVHGLLSITDPLDRVVTRNEYDASGRLIRMTNADGRTINFSHDIASRQQIITDADGGVSVLEYDARGNTVSSTDAQGNVTSSVYDANGNLLSTTNPAGETIVRTFDARNNQLTQTDPLGNTTLYQYDAGDNLTIMTDPLGRITLYSYDASGNLLSRTNPLGIVDQVLSYNSNGNLISETDALGNTVTFQYDAQGNQTKFTDAKGISKLIEYDQNGSVIAETDRRGFRSESVLDRRGLPVEETDPLGNRTLYGYGASRFLESATDPNGNQSSWQSDTLGKDMLYTDASGNTTEKRYDVKGNLISIIGPDLQKTEMGFDAVGRRTQETKPDGGTGALFYDSVGRIIQLVDALGNSSSYVYDAAGRNIKTIDPLGNETVFQYDVVGNQIAMIDANGSLFKYAYDDLNRMIETTLPNGVTESVEYDLVGQKVKEIDALGNVTNYTYDANGNLLEITDALGSITSFIYDKEDNLIEQVDARGNSTAFSYDSNGKMLSKVYPDGALESSRFDPAGNLIQKTNPDGEAVAYTYDADNRLLARTYTDGNVESFTYTDGRLQSATNSLGTATYAYNLRGQLSLVTNPDGSSIAYQYDLLGSVIRMTTKISAAASPRLTEYAYDPLNRLSRVTSPDGDETNYTYDSVGNLQSISYPNGVISSYTYDTANRLIQLIHSNGSSTLASFNYAYDLRGDATGITRLNGSTTEYEYDALRRLTRETYKDGLGIVIMQLTHSYDAAGNRQSTATAGDIVLFTYDNADKLLSQGTKTYSYDINGNLVSRSDGSSTTNFLFNAKNMLERVDSAGVITSYLYDPLNTLVGKNGLSGSIRYLADSNNLSGVSQLINEYVPSATLLNEYTYGGNLIGQNRAGVKSYAHRDAGQNIRLLSDNAGDLANSYDYLGYGQVYNKAETVENVYQFAGERIQPESGLLYLRARFYDPDSGRFMSRDTFQGNIENPISLHRYLYANANPISFVDPTGNVSLAGLMVAQGISQIMVALAPTLANGALTIAVLKTFYEPGFQMRNAGYLAMTSDLPFLSGSQQLFVSQMGFYSFLSGNELIKIGGFALDAGKALLDASLALIGASKAVGGFVTAGTAISKAGGGYKSYKALKKFAETSETAGDKMKQMGLVMKGKSPGADKTDKKAALKAARKARIKEATLKNLNAAKETFKLLFLNSGN